MKNAVIIIFFAAFVSGCVYTPKCAQPSNSMDGPISIITQPDNLLYVVNSNGDSKYCSGYISVISSSSPAHPSFIKSVPIRYDGLNISFLAGAYMSSTGGLLWLADRENNRVLIFDTSSDTITGSVGVDRNPVSITPADSINGDQLLLISNLSSDNISIISSNQKKVLYTIPLTNNGHGVAPLSAVATPSPVIINNQPPDMYAYVTRGADNNISVVSLNNHCEFNPMFPSSATTPVFSTKTAGSMATISSVKTYNCVTKSEFWKVSFTPATSDFLVVGSVSGKMKKHALSGVPYTSDNNYIGFTIHKPLHQYTEGDTFSFYTSASKGLINIPNVPGTGIANSVPATKGIAMTPDMKKIFVSYTGLDSVVVINAADNTVEKYIKVGKSPEAMLLSPDGSTLYVACYHSNAVYVINTYTETVIGRIGVGKGPFSMAFSADQHYLYVLNYMDNSLDSVDLNNFAVVSTLK